LFELLRLSEQNPLFFGKLGLTGAAFISNELIGSILFVCLFVFKVMKR